MLNLSLFIIIISSLCVIFPKNMIQSVLFLILVFLFSSILFIYVGAEFIGLIIMIVYIGAIAVSFLFVIMMLNIKILELNSKISVHTYLIISLCIFFFLLISNIYKINFNIFEIYSNVQYINWYLYKDLKILTLGELLFNECFLFFIGATFLLLVAMLGSISLTFEINKNLIIINKLQNTVIYWGIKEKKKDKWLCY